jgi:hypothetical protein
MQKRAITFKNTKMCKIKFGRGVPTGQIRTPCLSHLLSHKPRKRKLQYRELPLSKTYNYGRRPMLNNIIDTVDTAAHSVCAGISQVGVTSG